jgi:hypothetical protein
VGARRRDDVEPLDRDLSRGDPAFGIFLRVARREGGRQNGKKGRADRSPSSIAYLCHTAPAVESTEGVRICRT